MSRKKITNHDLMEQAQKFGQWAADDHDLLIKIATIVEGLEKSMTNHLQHHEQIEARMQAQMDRYNSCFWIMLGQLIKRLFSFWRK